MQSGDWRFDPSVGRCNRQSAICTLQSALSIRPSAPTDGTTVRLTSALADRYRIERELGEGGMATVYLAEDVKHDRKVAVKVLRPELAAVIGADRFLAEIKTTANLQHPHILPLHDSGEAGGTVFYVMPFVEGESLRDRLDREQQLPVDEALGIAREVADALDYAHRHGVIHRDIKPENILLHDGRALVADFGIALAVSRSEGGTRLTETGMSLGTPHYMSPEQAMGEREITAKSDVYALGCILYEMLTGEPPFAGPTAQAVIARVLTEEPRSLTLQRRTVPPHVEAAVRTALSKLPADRFASAAQFSEALVNPAVATAAAPAVLATAPSVAPRSHRLVATGVLAALGGVAVGALLLSLLRTTPSAGVLRYGLALPAAQEPNAEWRAIPSEDGSRIAYVGPAADGTQLWVKDRDSYQPTVSGSRSPRVNSSRKCRSRAARPSRWPTPCRPIPGSPGWTMAPSCSCASGVRASAACPVSAGRQPWSWPTARSWRFPRRYPTGAGCCSRAARPPVPCRLWICSPAW